MPSHPFELYFALFLFAFSAAITPGPNNVMLMSSGLNYGVKKSLPHLLGICLGFPLMVLLIGIGLGSIFERFPVTHTFIQICGVLYLLYLAWMIATTKTHDINSVKSKPLNFGQAALFQWINPKAWIMATGAIATYTTLNTPIYPQISIIALIFLITAFPSAATWLFFGANLKRFLQNPKHQHIFNIVMALLLVGSIIPVLINLIKPFLYLFKS
jgi:threonine/homoserine/homoserine lactone efflux protein